MPGIQPSLKPTGAWAKPGYNAGMTSQLRIYDIKPGLLDEFVDKVAAQIIPLRKQHGFGVSGPWRNDADNQFIWVVHYDGEDGFEAAAQRYYNDPARAELPFTPSDYILNADLRMLSDA